MGLVIFILGFLGFAFSVCPSGLSADLELFSEVSDKKGQNYRRADVLVFIPISKEIIKENASALRSQSRIYEVTSHVRRVDLKIKNISPYKVDDAFIVQEVGRKDVSVEDIRAMKIISKSPYIVEYISLYPTDFREGTVKIKLPPLRPGEELKVSYNVYGDGYIPDPTVRTSVFFTEEKSKRMYMLVAKYSFLFPYGKVKVEDINFENIKEVLKGLKEAGLKPIIRIVGIADGVTTDPKKNERVASGRATFVATRIFGEKYACHLRHSFAEVDKE